TPVARARVVPVPANENVISSRDRNLRPLSHEGGPLEDPWVEPAESMYLLTTSPENAPDEPEQLEITFESGTPVAVDGERLTPAQLIHRLNGRAGSHRMRRLDLVGGPE